MLVSCGLFTLVWGLLLLWRFTEHNYQQKILMIAVIVWLGLGIWYFISTAFLTRVLGDTILSFNRLVWGVLSGFVIVAYPVAAICPDWLRKRIFCIFAFIPVPIFILYFAYWAYTGKGIESYKSYNDIAGHWTDFTVILRLILFFISVGYNMVVLWLIMTILPVYESYVKNTYSDLDYNLKWLRVAAIFFTGITIAYTLNIFWFNRWTRIAFILVDLPLWMLLLNQAIFHKSFTPAGDFAIDWNRRKGWHELSQNVDDNEIPMAVDMLIRKMTRFMNTSEPYSDVNLTRNDFAKSIGTNRTTLSLAIKQMGYESFQDYINRMRVERFKALAAENPGLSVAGLCKLSGFSSRNTFYSYFKKVEGMLPGEFIEKVKNGSN